MKRSHEPVFWSLFGAGGMLAALFGPALVLITGIAVPLGWIDPGLMQFDRMHALAASWLGKGVLLAVIALFTWHAVHRIGITAHDLGVQAHTATKVVVYGFALVVTVVTAGALLAIG